MYIEKSTLEKAKENMEKALAKVKSIEDTKSLEWRTAWEEYKFLSGTYRNYLIAHYNL